MPKFVIDEDMPRSTGIILREHGYEVKDILGTTDFEERKMKRFMSLRKEKKR